MGKATTIQVRIDEDERDLYKKVAVVLGFKTLQGWLKYLMYEAMVGHINTDETVKNYYQNYRSMVIEKSGRMVSDGD